MRIVDNTDLAVLIALQPTPESKNDDKNSVAFGYQRLQLF